MFESKKSDRPQIFEMAIYIRITTDYKARTMKKLKLITAAAFALAITTTASFGSEDSHAKCCADAKKAGKECTHECCVQAHKDGKVCEKCAPKKEEEKPS